MNVTAGVTVGEMYRDAHHLVTSFLLIYRRVVGSVAHWSLRDG